MGMGEGVFIEVVDMGDGKIQWGQENEACGGEVGEKV